MGNFLLFRPIVHDPFSFYTRWYLPDIDAKVIRRYWNLVRHMSHENAIKASKRMPPPPIPHSAAPVTAKITLSPTMSSTSSPPPNTLVPQAPPPPIRGVFGFNLDFMTFHQLFPQLSMKDAVEHFNAWDDDRDGLIDFLQIVSALIIFSTSSFRSKVSALFEFFDVDESGGLGLEELKNLLRSCASCCALILGTERGKEFYVSEMDEVSQRSFMYCATPSGARWPPRVAAGVKRGGSMAAGLVENNYNQSLSPTTTMKSRKRNSPNKKKGGRKSSASTSTTGADNSPRSKEEKQQMMMMADDGDEEADLQEDASSDNESSTSGSASNSHRKKSKHWSSNYLLTHCSSAHSSRTPEIHLESFTLFCGVIGLVVQTLCRYNTIDGEETRTYYASLISAANRPPPSDQWRLDAARSKGPHSYYLASEALEELKALRNEGVRIRGTFRGWLPIHRQILIWNNPHLAPTKNDKGDQKDQTNGGSSNGGGGGDNKKAGGSSSTTTLPAINQNPAGYIPTSAMSSKSRPGTPTHGSSPHAVSDASQAPAHAQIVSRYTEEEEMMDLDGDMPSSFHSNQHAHAHSRGMMGFSGGGKGHQGKSSSPYADVASKFKLPTVSSLAKKKDSSSSSPSTTMTSTSTLHKKQQRSISLTNLSSSQSLEEPIRNSDASAPPPPATASSEKDGVGGVGVGLGGRPTSSGSIALGASRPASRGDALALRPDSRASLQRRTTLSRGRPSGSVAAMALAARIKMSSSKVQSRRSRDDPFNGHFSYDRVLLKQAKALFDSLDKSGGGEIEIGDLTMNLETTAPHLGAAMSAFRSLDVDQTGTIDFGELLRALFPMASPANIRHMMSEVSAIDITKKDIQLLQKVFEWLDDDFDGLVPFNTFITHLKSNAHDLGKPYARDYQPSRMSVALMDEDTRLLTFAECVHELFAKSHAHMMGEIKKWLTNMDVPALTDKQHIELEQLFQLYDKDGSGTIEMDELRGHFTSLGFSEEDNARMFRMFDRDGGGEVDLTEFKRFYRSVYESRYDDQGRSLPGEQAMTPI